jgi:predicted glutamine amidotransferase
MAELGDEAFEMIQGTTDSEYLFAVFTQLWSDRSDSDPADRLAGALADCLSHCVRTVGYTPELSYLNVAVSDGRASVISRVTNDDPENAESLHYHTGRAYVCFEGVCRMIAPDAQGHAVIVASERLSDEDDWGEVPPNHMILVHPDRTTELRSIEL